MPPAGSTAAGPTAGARRRDARAGTPTCRVPLIPQTWTGLTGEHRDKDRHHHNSTGLRIVHEMAAKLVGWVCIWLHRGLLVVIPRRPTGLRMITDHKRCAVAVLGVAASTYVILRATNSDVKVRPTTAAKESSRRSMVVPGRGIIDLRSLGYRSKPRTMGCYFLGVEANRFSRTNLVRCIPITNDIHPNGLCICRIELLKRSRGCGRAVTTGEDARNHSKPKYAGRSMNGSSHCDQRAMRFIKWTLMTSVPKPRARKGQESSRVVIGEIRGL